MILRTARNDLRPFDGRFAMAWRVAAQCSLASLVFMTYGIPLAAIGCYLILFLMKPDGAESTLMAIGVAVLVSLVVILLIYLARWTIDDPMWRMVVIAVGSFTFIYIGAASLLGPIGNILALVVGFSMSLLSDVPFGEAATRAVLYAWLMTVAPMGIIVIFNLLFGRSAVHLLQQELARRLETAAQALDQAVVTDELLELLRTGNEELKKRAGFIRLLHLAPSAQTQYLTSAIDDTYRLLLAVATLATYTPEPLRHELASQSRLAAQAVEAHQPLDTPHQDKYYDEGPIGEAQLALDVLLGHRPSTTEQASKTPFFFKDALSNPDYPRFALKTTAAAIISYLIYTAIDWQGIHTAMITCYVAALTTTAETVHKLTLRIIGCLIGAAMGVASILFLIPHMTSIGGLMVLVFAGILVAGWVSSGSERIAYAGIQIGLAFLLTILQDFGPSIELSAASDRVMGILLGNLVMYLVFTRIWPLSIASAAHDKINSALNQLAQITRSQPSRSATMDEISKILATLHEAREGLRLARFEPKNLRQDDEIIMRLKTLISDTEDLCRGLAFQPAAQTYTQTISEINQMQQLLSKIKG
ncbi:FUSC family protein [Alcaligenaceae bacterium]|nr:FUSC family protein [Alcaligenaceae bacterium]